MLFVLAFDFKQARFSSRKYFLMNLMRYSRFRFFNLHSKIIDSGLVFLILQISIQG